MSLKRGLLIVFEGCDKTGKSTQCKLLFEELKQKNIEVRMISFPNRTTQTGPPKLHLFTSTFKEDDVRFLEVIKLFNKIDELQYLNGKI